MGTRRERVVVSLDDDFSSPMQRCAGATALLNHELDRLSGQAIVSSRFARTVERDMDGVSKSTRQAGADINQLSGRLSLLARFVAVFGPTASPIGAVAAAGIAGLAAQFGFATVGALSLVVAVQGVGDALKAVEEARLEPTADNLAKAEQAMAKLAPEAREFVEAFQEMRPVLGDMQKAAARGWLPGLTEALGSLEDAAPRIERILEAVSRAGGDAVADGAASLAGERWEEFFAFIEAEAPGAISDLSKMVGSLAHGLAELWMAFDPLNDDLLDGLVDAAAAFDDWAAGLDETEGFEEFIDYVRANGPIVADAATAVADAILEIAEAAAPIGGPVLETITGLAEALAAIADSPIGTPVMAAVTAVSALSLASRGLDAALKGANVQLAAMGAQSPRTAAALGMVHKAALALVGIEIGSQILDGIRDSAVGAAPSVEKLAGSLQQLDTAGLKEELGGSLKELVQASNQGGLKGMSEDLASAAENASLFGVNIGGAMKAFVPQLGYMGVETERARKATKSLDEALVQMVATAGGDATKQAFDELAESEGLSADAKRDLLKLLPGYKDALAAAGLAADSAAGSTDKFKGSLDGLKTAYSDLAAVLTKQGAWTAYQSSLDTLTESIKRNGKTLDENTRAGQENRTNLNALAENAIRVSDSMDGMERKRFLRQAIEDFRKGAEEAGGLDAKARAVLRLLQQIEKASPKPEIKVNDKASPTLRAIIDQINQVRSKNVTIATTWKNFYTGAPGKPKTPKSPNPTPDPWRGPLQNPADGGTIPRFGGRPIRSAAGSTVPDDGGGYRDYLLYMLAPLEEVISNRRGQADRFRPELKDINAGMSRAEVIERMLMRGLVTTPRTAADGTPGKPIVSTLNQTGAGPRKGDNVLGFFPEVGKSTKELKAWVKSLEESRSTIEDELKERQSLADALGESIKNRLTTNPFGDTDPWSAGSTFEDVMAVLTGDTTAARAQTEDIQALRDKGLDGDALTALLADADNETIAAWADLSAEQLDQYERAFQDRALAVADAQTAAMNAAFGAQLASTNALLDQVIAEQQEANRLLAIAPDATGKKAGEQTGKSLKKSAGKGVQGIKGGGR